MVSQRKPPARSTSAKLAVQALHTAIVEGEHEPGSFLRLSEVSEQLGMSMMPVREAIRELAALGLVEIIPHRGAQVRRYDVDDLIETYRGRIFLESLALKIGAPRFTEELEIAAKAANEARTKAILEGDDVVTLSEHENLHFLLYRSADNEWIQKAILPGWRNAERYRFSSMLDVDLRDRLDHEHILLIEAMVARDAEAAVTILHRHLSSAAESVGLVLGGKSIMHALPKLEELL